MKSTALLFGDRVRVTLVVFAVAFVGALVAIGVMNNQSWLYFFISCGGAAAHFAWQFASWDMEDAKDCGAKFKVRAYLL